MNFIKIIILLLCCFPLYGIDVPYSTIPVSTETNLITGFLRIDPDDRQADLHETRLNIWYDEDNLYTEIKSVWDSACTVGRFSGRDIGSNGDYLFLNLITNPDTYSNYYYGATPTGGLYDGTRDLPSGLSRTWNSSYSYTTELIDSLWTVVFTIPFRDIRFNASPPYNWEIRFAHYFESDRSYYAYPYYSEVDPKNYYDNALPITLTHKIKRQLNWKLRPYFVKSYDLLNKTTTFDPENVGIDISFNPDPRTKMKLALNPDFSDVPPDNARDIYNEKYRSYYSENRFFFIEDIDAFGVDSELFYTRNIIQPQIALKLTSSSDTWTFGYLGVQDKEIRENGSLLNPDDYYQMMSVKNRQNLYSIQLSGGSRINTGYYNHFFEGVWDWEYARNLHVGAMHAYSIYHDAQAESASERNKQGAYQKVYLQATPNNWDISAQYANISKDVRFDMGYFYETGLEEYQFMADYTSTPVDRYFRKMRCISSINYTNKLEHHRPLVYASWKTNLTLYFSPKYNICLAASRGRDEYAGKYHDVYKAHLLGNSYKYAFLRISGSVTYGKDIIYSIRQAKNYYSVMGQLNGDLKRNTSWSVDLTHYHYQYDNKTYVPEWEETICLDNSYQIANLSLKYNFSNQLSLSNGLGISSYQTKGNYANLTFYSNFSYEFRKDCLLFIGYKTGQFQNKPSTTDDWDGHIKRKSASAYLKVVVSL